MQDILLDAFSQPEHSQNANQFIDAAIDLLSGKYNGRINFDDRDVMNLTEFDLEEGPATVTDLIKQGMTEEAKRHQEETDALDAESANLTRVQVVFWGDKAKVMEKAKKEIDHLADEFYGSLDPNKIYPLQDTKNEPLRGLPRWCYTLEYIFPLAGKN